MSEMMEKGPFIDDKFNLNNLFKKIGISKPSNFDVDWSVINERLRTNPNEADSIFKNTFGENAYQKLVDEFKVNPALMSDIREHVGIISDEILEQFKGDDTQKSTEDKILDAIKEEILWRLISEITSGIISSL